MPEMRQDRIALDRAASARTIDADGHMRVLGSAVSKANVCGYAGAEIPGCDELGLDPRKIYKLYREAGALKAAADSLAGKPLLIIHKPQTAEDHDHKVVVGSLDNPVWDAPYLRADISIWDQAAIDAVTSGEQKALSCGYRYVPVMQPGTAPDGSKYDGLMTEIAMNHCALVAEGRAGPDVYVGDSALPASLPIIEDEITMATNAKNVSRMALLASGALRPYLRSKMAADAAMPDLKPVVGDVTAANWKTSKPKIAARLKKVMAADADISDVLQMLDMLDDLPEAEEPPAVDEKPEAAMDDKDDDEDKKAPPFVKKSDDDDDDDDKKPKAKDKKRAMDVAAMDAAITSAAAAAEQRAVQRMMALREAERVVRPIVGDINVALDSADAVYKLALDHAGIDTEGVHPSAFPALIKIAQNAAAAAAAPKHSTVSVAMDAKASADRAARFPHAHRLAAN